jgi:hypothetical protein
MTPVARRLRPRLLWLSLTRLALALALAAGCAAGTAHAADQRLADALDALEKAQALLLAAESGVVSPKVEKKFDRQVGRAVDLIGRAMEKIQAAQEAVDNP